MVSAHAVALRPTAAPAVSAPTRLRLPDLLHATDRGADEVLDGRYDHLLPAGGPPTDDVVHPAARRRRTRRLADQLGAGSARPNCTTTAARWAR